MLPLGQRWKVDKIHFLIGRQSYRRQESLGLILMMLLFNSSNTICLETIDQFPLAFFFSTLCLFLLFPPHLFLQSFLLCYFCLFLGLALKAFLFFLLSKQGFRLCVSSGQLSLVKLIIGIREVSNRGRLEGHGGRISG